MFARDFCGRCGRGTIRIVWGLSILRIAGQVVHTIDLGDCRAKVIMNSASLYLYAELASKYQVFKSD